MSLNQQNSQTDEILPYVLSVSDAAKQMGVHRNTVYDLIRANRIPAFKIGRRVLIKRDLLFAYIDQLADSTEANIV